MELSPLEDHYRNPRHLGELEAPDAVALVHNPACGDMMRLAVQVSDGRITAARFKAYGCAAAVAAGSVVAEMLQGRTLGEAAAIGDDDILGVLGPLPPMKVHALVLARECIQQALARLDGTGPEVDG